MPSEYGVWEKPLRECSRELRRIIFQKGPVSAILFVCELALNYQKGTFDSKKNGKELLSSFQKRFVEQLADRLLPIRRKRKFLASVVGLNLVGKLLELVDG